MLLQVYLIKQCIICGIKNKGIISPVIIDTKHKNIRLKNRIHGNIPRSGAIYRQKQILMTYVIIFLDMVQNFIWKIED